MVRCNLWLALQSKVFWPLSHINNVVVSSQDLLLLRSSDEIDYPELETYETCNLQAGLYLSELLKLSCMVCMDSSIEGQRVQTCAASW